jgi:hypothetical protein
MSVYFAYRCHYNQPNCKFVRRFDAPSILDWFRANWEGEADYSAASKLALEKLGCQVYSFGNLFVGIAENELLPPRTNAELHQHLEEFLYVNEMAATSHAIQVYTDDDELEMAIYFFDDWYLTRNPAKAAYLAHKDWDLPTEAGKGGFKTSRRSARLKPDGNGTGTVFLAFEDFYASDNLDCLPKAYRIDGIRLPELCQYLVAAQTKVEWPFELLVLRARLFRKALRASQEEAAFLKAIRHDPSVIEIYSDWLEERGQSRAGLLGLERGLQEVSKVSFFELGESSMVQLGGGSWLDDQAALDEALKKFQPRRNFDSSKSHIRVHDHVAQLCLHVDRWSYGGDLYHHWVLFDDLWAGANPDLANSILRYAERWDPLS